MKGITNPHQNKKNGIKNKIMKITIKPAPPKGAEMAKDNKRLLMRKTGQLINKTKSPINPSQPSHVLIFISTDFGAFLFIYFLVTN